MDGCSMWGLDGMAAGNGRRVSIVLSLFTLLFDGLFCGGVLCHTKLYRFIFDNISCCILYHYFPLVFPSTVFRVNGVLSQWGGKDEEGV